MTQILDAPDAPFRLTAPIEHITKLDDGTLLVHCVVTSETPDSQGEIVDYDAFKRAAPGLMKWASVQEMHDPSTAAGTIMRLYFDDEQRRVEADLHVVDPVAVKKVLSRTYKAVSIGGEGHTVPVAGSAGQRLRRIVRMIVNELSLVNRPANPDALIAKQFILAKRAQESDMTDAMDAGMTSPLGDERTPEQLAIDATREALAKAEVSTASINDLPDSDFAYIEPGGQKDDSGRTTPRSLRHFPIQDAAHVRNALARLSTSPFESKARPKVEAAARRLGIGEPAQSKKARKAARKMAKKEVTKQQAPPAPPPAEAQGDGGQEAPKPAFPGAQPPFGSKKARKAARKAARVAKAAVREEQRAKLAQFAKGNKTISALSEALEAVMCAISEEADEGDDDAVKTLQGIAAEIQQCMAQEAAEPDADAFDPDMAMAYAKSRRRLADRAATIAKRRRALRKRFSKARASVARMRKSVGELRKERRELRKAAVLTSVLTKAGSRNSKSDLAKIDAIHEATVDLGTTAHRSPAAAEPDVTSSETPLAKSATIMHDALKGVLPAATLERIEARLAAIDERSSAQGEQLAKIAKRPREGGPATPYAPVFRGGVGEVTDKASALEKAASVVDDPRLKVQISEAAALESIRTLRS